MTTTGAENAENYDSYEVYLTDSEYDENQHQGHIYMHETYLTDSGYAVKIIMVRTKGVAIILSMIRSAVVESRAVDTRLGHDQISSGRVKIVIWDGALWF
jgi:hypothetical protein